MKRFVFLFIPWLMFCGQARHADDRGKPLLTLKGQTVGALSGATQVNSPRAALVWSKYSPQLLACVEGATSEEESNACWENHPGPNSVAEDVAIEASFPTGFEIPIAQLPGDEFLNGDDNGKLGLGVLYAYEDGNLNEQLDLIDEFHPSTEDRMLGASAPFSIFDLYTSEGNIVEWRWDVIIYREGELGPLWNKLLNAHFNCPEPAQGFNLYHQTQRISGLATPESNTELGCERLNLSDVITVQVDDSRAVLDTMCTDSMGGYDELVWVTDEHPALEHFFCGFSGTMLITYVDPLQPACQEIGGTLNSIVYLLPYSDGELIIPDEVPDWWPCEIY